LVAITASLLGSLSERQWERLGAASGIGFVAAMIVSVFLAPPPPHIDASTAQILDYITRHRGALLGALVVGALAGALFLVFLGHLRHVLGRSERGAGALSPIVYGAGLTTVAIAYRRARPWTSVRCSAPTPTCGSSVPRTCGRPMWTTSPSWAAWAR
jgi:hypothetical protein